MATRKTTETEKKVFDFLDSLRSSGATNMYGATPYLTNAFPKLSEDEANDLLCSWMENSNSEGNYDEIKENSVLNIADVIHSLSPEFESMHYQSRDRNQCYLQSLLTEAKSKGNLARELIYALEKHLNK